VAPLLEAIQTIEESIVSDLPLAADFALVLVIGDLEVSASVESDLQLGMCLISSIVLDVAED
jgi:hypothetical protein